LQEDFLMTITLEQFREAAAARRGDRKHGARRYDEALIAFAVRHAQSLVSTGMSVHAAAKALSISMMTLQSWQRRSAANARTSKVRKVVVTRAPLPAATASGVTVTTVAGHVVSGLDVAQAAALLKALS
jgi:hypothetical protein